MYENPTYQSPAPQNLQTLLDAFANTLLKNLNCVRPGVIQSFNAANATVVVRIAQQQVTSISPTGVSTIAEFPLLLQVPVLFPSGGGFTLTFPIAAGDECLVLFNDRQLDNWKLTGAGQPPSIDRTHDLSDAFAVAGIRNFTRALADISTTSVQLRSDDGATYVDVSSGKIQLVADEVVIHGRNKTTFDAGGTGFVYTPALITTYTDGVATAHNPPNPPEVPT